MKMKYNPDIHHRRSIRLKGYDYSQPGLYFITICVSERLCLFGKIQNRAIILNDAGKMLQSAWNQAPIFYTGFHAREYVIMPNHIHGVIEIKPNPTATVGAGPCACPEKIKRPPGKTAGRPQGVAPTGKQLSLPDIVHRFKTLTTKRYVDGVNQNHWPRFNKKLWQRNYYEHIIRSKKTYLQILEYIRTNPLKWREDNYYRPNHT